MAETAENSCERLDPRIRRTREMLFQALEKLLLSKTFEQLSVTDIADAATLNRATFYDHYSDKYALLQGLVEARLQQLMKHRGLVFDGSCATAIKGIILATCDYLAGVPGLNFSNRDLPNRGSMDKHFEPAVIAVLRQSILSGLRNHESTGEIAPELRAAVASGAIYSGVREWVATPQRCTAPAAVDSIFKLVSPILAAG